MGTRRVTSYAVPGGPPQRAAYCYAPACCTGAQARPRLRYRVTTTSGAAQNCGLNIQSLDPSAAPGRFMEIEGTWTRTWKTFPAPGSTVGSCAMTFTRTRSGDRTKRLSELCGGSNDETSDCAEPGACAGPGCYYEDTPIIYTGNDPVTESEVQDAAESFATDVVGSWSAFSFQWGNAINAAGSHLVSYTSGLVSASFTRRTIEIEVRGFARPHTLTWLDTITTIATGSTTTEERTLEITGPGVYEIVMDPAPGTSRSMGTIQVTVPAND